MDNDERFTKRETLYVAFVINEVHSEGFIALMPNIQRSIKIKKSSLFDPYFADGTWGLLRMAFDG